MKIKILEALNHELPIGTIVEAAISPDNKQAYCWTPSGIAQYYYNSNAAPHYSIVPEESKPEGIPASIMLGQKSVPMTELIGQHPKKITIEFFEGV